MEKKTTHQPLSVVTHQVASFVLAESEGRPAMATIFLWLCRSSEAHVFYADASNKPSLNQPLLPSI